ncbi:MAG: electron transfer flavoprotein subunit beta/FixA family protein, partial [Oscillospiraceae bacterium]|nr:electron transfer flavoprotein subunit beta/FixA family protein [Oscillospiraceae bacterium]
MNIAVCIKQVPSSNEVRLDPVRHTIIRDSKQSVINPYDLHALEVAVSLKERLGGAITAISMGIPATEALLRDAVARGADKGMLLSDRAFAGADTLATSYTLAAGIRSLKERFDLVLCGKMATDGDTAQIGPELAEQLHIPHVTDVSVLLDADENSLTVRHTFGAGYRDLRVVLPALLTVTREINLPRLPSLAGLRRALDASCLVIGAAGLDAAPDRIGIDGSPTQVVRTFMPTRKIENIVIGGNAVTQAKTILDLVRET